MYSSLPPLQTNELDSYTQTALGTGTFPFMSLEGNICFLIVHHYESNAILALLITNFTDETILTVYEQQFELLELQGHKILLNVLDNRASKVIKKYLTVNQCDNLLLDLNNHRVTRLNGPYKPSKCTLSVRLPQPTASFHSNCGTS